MLKVISQTLEGGIEYFVDEEARIGKLNRFGARQHNVVVPNAVRGRLLIAYVEYQRSKKIHPPTESDIAALAVPWASKIFNRPLHNCYAVEGRGGLFYATRRRKENSFRAYFPAYKRCGWLTPFTLDDLV